MNPSSQRLVDLHHAGVISRRELEILELCYLCRTPLEPTTMQVDHIIPLALGGTHTDENVAAACGRCNSRKGKRIVSFAIATRKPVYREAC